MPKASKSSHTQVTLDLDSDTIEGIQEWNRTAYAPGWLLYKLLQSIQSALPGEISTQDENLKTRNLVGAYMEMSEHSTLQEVVHDTGIPELPAKRALEDLVRNKHLKREGPQYWFCSAIARAH